MLPNALPVPIKEVRLLLRKIKKLLQDLQEEEPNNPSSGDSIHQKGDKTKPEVDEIFSQLLE